MKKFLILIPLVLIMSCKKSNNNILNYRTMDIEVIYYNGDKDTLQVYGDTPQLDKGDLDIFIDNNSYTNYKTVASGVRSFKLLK